MSFSLKIWKFKDISKFTHNSIWACTIYKTAVTINSKFSCVLCLFIPYSIEIYNCCINFWINWCLITIKCFCSIFICIPTKECLCAICKCLLWKCKCRSKLWVAWIHSSWSTIIIVIDSIFIWTPLCSKY